MDQYSVRIKTWVFTMFDFEIYFFTFRENFLYFLLQLFFQQTKSNYLVKKDIHLLKKLVYFLPGVHDLFLFLAPAKSLYMSLCIYFSFCCFKSVMARNLLHLVNYDNLQPLDKVSRIIFLYRQSYLLELFRQIRFFVRRIQIKANSARLDQPV